LNQPPEVDAGPDVTTIVGADALLAGTATDDGLPAGGVLSVAWTVVSGPGAPQIERPDQPATPVRFDVPGTYVLELIASDSELSASDEVTIVVEAGGTMHPPVIISQPPEIFALPTLSAEPPQPVDLSAWSVVQYELNNQGDASWQIDPTGIEVVQAVNADASILLSDFDLVSDRIEGTWRVDTTSDDDFMGFVFGHQDDQHFYLFDWKKSSQNHRGLAQVGMTVKVVEADSALTGFDLWPSAGNGERVRPLYANSVPWVSFVEYEFSLEFHPGEFTITVRQGETVLE
jgi:hypothetical protein